MNDFYAGGLGKDRKVEFYNGSTFLSLLTGKRFIFHMLTKTK